MITLIDLLIFFGIIFGIVGIIIFLCGYYHLRKEYTAKIKFTEFVKWYKLNPDSWEYSWCYLAKNDKYVTFSIFGYILFLVWILLQRHAERRKEINKGQLEFLKDIEKDYEKQKKEKGI